jgi:hypothetical protein
LKRRAIELYGLLEEVDVYNRIEFELFAFGIIPTSASLPLLKEREVIYVNLLPPRPATPFSLSLAPSRAENSLVAEVRRPGTGLPFEVVYTQRTSDAQQFKNEQEDLGSELGPAVRRKGFSRFKEHMSQSGSRKSRSLSVGEVDNPRSSSGSKDGRKSPNKNWSKEGGPADGQGLLNPLQLHGSAPDVRY